MGHNNNSFFHKNDKSNVYIVMITCIYNWINWQSFILISRYTNSLRANVLQLHRTQLFCMVLPSYMSLNNFNFNGNITISTKLLLSYHNRFKKWIEMYFTVREVLEFRQGFVTLRYSVSQRDSPRTCRHMIATGLLAGSKWENRDIF